MPKRFIKRNMPTPDRVQSIQSLKFLGDVLHEPNLWHINRHAVSRAFLVGLFLCCIPIPFQMIGAVLLSIWINANVPLSLALVWISNPLTMPPMFYFNYRIGAWILGQPPLDFEFQLSWAWISERIVDIGAPLYLGSFVVGAVAGGSSYLILQYLWRRHVRTAWHQRQTQRREARSGHIPS